MRELKVTFNGKRIHNHEKLPLHDVQKQPVITFNKPANKYYTYMMVDPDAPYKDNPTYKHWLHWLVVNVSNNKTTQKEIAEFKPSAPPPPENPGETNEHRYYFYLFEQPFGVIENVETQKKRMNFNVENFIRENKLKPISCVMYTTEYES